MKTLKILLAVIVLMSAACREKTTENKAAPLQSVTDEIIYSVPIMNPLDSATTNENLALAERELFLKTIFDAATTGKLVVYSDPEFKTVLKPDEITTADPVPIDTTKKKEVKKDSAAIKISPVIDFKKIERVSFIEQWSIDSASYSIVKTIKGYSPLIGVYIEDPKLKTKIFKGWKSVFWVKCK
ncbi:MAG: hypothetical protein V2A54_10875 [Bacteroidota bacterium]